MDKTSKKVMDLSLQPAEDVLRRIDISRIKIYDGPHNRNYMANYIFYENGRSDSGKPALVQRIFEVGMGFYNDTCTGFKLLGEKRVIFFKSKMTACICDAKGEMEPYSLARLRKTYERYVLIQKPEEICGVIRESIFAKSGFIEAYEADFCRFEKVGDKSYLWVYQKEPRIEQLIKAGFTKVARDIFRGEKLDCAQEVTKVHKMLGVSKKALGELRKSNPTLEDLRRYKHLKKVDPRLDVATWNALDCFHIADATFDSLLWVMEHYGLHTCDILDYLSAANESQCISKSEIMKLWADYVHMAGELGIQLKGAKQIYPSSLKLTHDRMKYVSEFMEEESEAERIERILKELGIEYKKKERLTYEQE